MVIEGSVLVNLGLISVDEARLTAEHRVGCVLAAQMLLGPVEVLLGGRGSESAAPSPGHVKPCPDLPTEGRAPIRQSVLARFHPALLADPPHLLQDRCMQQPAELVYLRREAVLVEADSVLLASQD